MSYQLVIAEKPGVARSIAAVIGATDRQEGYLQGNGYLVSWCIGHLVSFADAGVYDERFRKWRYEDLPIIPENWRLTVPPDKRERFDTLRTLLRSEEVSEVINACDAGREGGLIFRTVYHLAGCTKPMKRLWISSMEDSAIREDFAHLKPGRDYDPLHQSALCRAKSDWLIGINATRLFSVLYHKTLPVGRVQTPTLKMLADRDAKITGFQKEKYHIVHIAGGGMEGAAFSPNISRVLNSAKVSDHHAIIPTAEFVKQGFSGLADGEKKLLSLVCCKLLCAVAPAHEYEAVTAVFTCAGQEFTAKGKTILRRLPALRAGHVGLLFRLCGRVE